MAVSVCLCCNENRLEKRRFGQDGFPDGEDCPVCYRPTCRYHLKVVRWKWRVDNQVEEALVCQTCRRNYEHRHWDTANRDWIT